MHVWRHKRAWTLTALDTQVLSRYPLTERAPVLLETGARADATNRRRALVVEAATPGGAPLTLVNVHLTYHDLGQCEAVLLLRAAVEELGPRTVVLGDMNTYLDFAWCVGACGCTTVRTSLCAPAMARP
jgi:endonuclease/exonuclease/phosphatase family metal-dependent hydrolase